jgi:hypothetical protein
MALLAGCGRAAPQVEPVSFASPIDVVVAQPATQSSVTMTARGGLAPAPTRLDLPVAELKLELQTGAHPQLAMLEVPVGDIDVSAEALPPHGLQLRDLRLAVDAPVALDVIHAQDDALELRASTPLTLHWSVVLEDGTLWPLGPTRTVPVDVEVQVVRANGQSTLTATTHCPGTCWELDGVANLSDGSLYVEAAADVTAR